MGAKCSGSYADLFMGRFEGQQIFPRINDRHQLYSRFKDDIFMVWSDGLASLLHFFEEINSVHPSIKFDCHHSKESISFLDSKIHMDASGNLKTSLYAKPTDRNAYLHHQSPPEPDKEHPLWEVFKGEETLFSTRRCNQRDGRPRQEVQRKRIPRGSYRIPEETNQLGGTKGPPN